MFQVAMFTVLIFPLFVTGQLDQKKVEKLLKSNNILSAKVRAVPQGDLVSIDLNKELISVRLAGIDSPEPRQPFFRQARQFTEDLVMAQTVKVAVRYVDRFKRIIGEIILLNGRIVNQEVIRWGYAWHYRVSPKPSLILERLEYEAWKKRLGLWALEAPIPPWKFRTGSLPLEPPSSPANVDYDRIFEYGLFGNRKTRLFSWPECFMSSTPSKENRIIFSSKLEAKNYGYNVAPNCSK